MHDKFLSYINRFIEDSVNNCLQYSIAKRNLEITHYKIIAQVACKKLIGRVVKKKGHYNPRNLCKNYKESGNWVWKGKEGFGASWSNRVKKKRGNNSCS